MGIAGDQTTLRVGLLTSGGDAPGMNAAIRTVVRVACAKSWKVMGFFRGYQGLIESDCYELGPRDVSNIIHRGGTILKTSRCAEFKTQGGLELARDILNHHKIDALIIIGGNGSFRGAFELGKYWKGQMIGIPGTIDNDVYGTDYTIGYDTAVNTALEAIDKIRDTADAHERFFLVEVMGREAGFIALDAGIGGGAEMIFLPDQPVDIKQICARLVDGRSRGKSSSILVAAEQCRAYDLAEQLKAQSHYDYRVAVLSYIQRGGNPSARDRVLATKLGSYALDIISQGLSGVMVGDMGGKLVITEFEKTFSVKKPLDPYLVQLLDPLST